MVMLLFTYRLTKLDFKVMDRNSKRRLHTIYVYGIAGTTRYSTHSLFCSLALDTMEEVSELVREA